MNKDIIEKANIVFKESKARLLSSQRNYDQLNIKISHFGNLCVASIGGLATAISFLSGHLIYQSFLCVLLLGFAHSLCNLLNLSKTNRFASDGIGAITTIDHDDYNSKDSSSLLRSLAKTYEKKADHNYALSDEIARKFDKTLINIKRYIVLSFLTPLLILSLRFCFVRPPVDNPVRPIILYPISHTSILN